MVGQRFQRIYLNHPLKVFYDLRRQVRLFLIKCLLLHPVPLYLVVVHLGLLIYCPGLWRSAPFLPHPGAPWVSLCT